MLDAHVKFELRQWQGAALNKTLKTEATAILEWLESVPVGQLLSDRKALDAAVTVALDASLSQLVPAAVTQAAQAVTGKLSKDNSKLSAVIDKDSYDQLAATVIGMQELRHELIAQATTNDAYSQLISHVMYQGIKNYIQTENVITRKVPGASTLMKMSQSAMSTAAPKLEKAIDKQLTAFIASNVQDSVRESQRYLDKVLDEKLLTVVADEVWQANANAKVSQLAGLVSPASIDQLVAAGHATWAQLRQSKVFLGLVDAITTDLLDQFGERTVGELLADAGVSSDEVVAAVIPLAKPVVARAVKDGLVEARIRARLEPFYTSYFK